MKFNDRLKALKFLMRKLGMLKDSGFGSGENAPTVNLQINFVDASQASSTPMPTGSATHWPQSYLRTAPRKRK